MNMYIWDKPMSKDDYLVRSADGSAWEDFIGDGQIRLASLKALQSGGACAFVWPDEGSFVGQKWKFNEAHEKEFEPLWVDPTTAKMLVMVYDALQNPEIKDKFAEWIAKGRGHFGALVEKGWSLVKWNGV